MRVLNALGLLSLGFSGSMSAQTDADMRITEKTVITGSSIKRVQNEGSLPLQIFTREDLLRLGIVTAEQFIMMLNANGNGLDNLASNSDVVAGAQRGNNGLSAANLRGQGSSATLILLNGRRVAAYGLNGGVVVVNKFGFRRSFSDKEVGICQALANLASISLQNGNLFAQINVANEQLKRLSNLKSDLLHIISHDLKSPLTVISGYAEILLDGPQKMAENWQSILQEILSQTRMMARLIEDTLAISKIESGVMELNLETMDAAQAIENLVAIHQHECVFKSHFPPNLPKVRADKLRLHEILDNLITNAIKYSKSANEITISAAPDLKSGVMIISVRDRGFGIPEHEIPNLFKKFYRIKNEASQQIRGTGLGLYIVKQMVEAHSGNIWVESKLHEGSTFFFSLPLAS